MSEADSTQESTQRARSRRTIVAGACAAASVIFALESAGYSIRSHLRYKDFLKEIHHAPTPAEVNMLLNAKGGYGLHPNVGRKE